MNSSARSHRMTVLLTVTIIALAASAHADSGDEVAPDPLIQAELQRLEKNMSLPGANTEAVADEAARDMALVMYRLRKLDKPLQPGYLMSQLIYYGIHSKYELSWGVIGLVMQQGGIDQSGQIAGVMPFLTDPDPEIKKAATELLPVGTGRDGHADFSYFMPYMDSPELTHWMYKHDPAGALQAFMQRSFTLHPPKTKEQRASFGERQREISWAQHIIDNALRDLGYGYIIDQDGVTRSLTQKEQFRSRIMAPHGMTMVVDVPAIEQLNMLSKRSEWWTRLYVATFIQQHPAFRTQALIDRLKADKNELVRDTVQEFTEPKLKPKVGARSNRR